MLRLFGVVATSWQRVCASTRSYALKPLDLAEQNYDLELEIIHTHGHMIAFTQEVIHCHHAKSQTVCWTVVIVGVSTSKALQPRRTYRYQAWNPLFSLTHWPLPASLPGKLHLDFHRQICLHKGWATPMIGAWYFNGWRRTIAPPV